MTDPAWLSPDTIDLLRSPWAWLSTGIALAAFELIVATMIGLTLGLAALGTGLALLSGGMMGVIGDEPHWAIPLAIFAILTVPSLGLARAFAQRATSSDTPDPNADPTPRNPAYDEETPERRPIRKEPEGTPDGLRVTQQDTTPPHTSGGKGVPRTPPPEKP